MSFKWEINNKKDSERCKKMILEWEKVSQSNAVEACPQLSHFKAYVIFYVEWLLLVHNVAAAVTSIWSHFNI